MPLVQDSIYTISGLEGRENLEPPSFLTPGSCLKIQMHHGNTLFLVFPEGPYFTARTAGFREVSSWLQGNPGTLTTDTEKGDVARRGPPF